MSTRKFASRFPSFGDHLDIHAGNIPGFSIVNKFGATPSMATTEYAIWGSVAAYAGFLQAADEIRIKAGGNAADTAAGAGAQSIRVEGLDENWEIATEDIVTAGASASTKTTTKFIRVYRAYVLNVGTYGAANTAAITIETEAGATVALIPAGRGQTTMAIYTVPAGYEAYITGVHFSGDSNQAANFFMYQRQNADDVTTPFQGKRLILQHFGINGPHAPVEHIVNGAYPAKTDIWMAGAATGSTASIVAEFDILLVKV
jgi:hypothetical protein